MDLERAIMGCKVAGVANSVDIEYWMGVAIFKLKSITNNRKNNEKYHPILFANASGCFGYSTAIECTNAASCCGDVVL